MKDKSIPYPQRDVCSACGKKLSVQALTSFATVLFCSEHSWCFKRLEYRTEGLFVRYGHGDSIPLDQAVKRGKK